MLNLIKYLVVLILTIGVLFLTTECEAYFYEYGHHVFSQEIPAEKPFDGEHTHVSHHLINDLISEASTDFYIQDSIVLINSTKPLACFNNNYFTSIWQPPKFS